MKVTTKNGFQGSLNTSRLVCSEEALELSVTLSDPRYYEQDAPAFQAVADYVRRLSGLPAEELGDKQISAKAALEGFKREVEALTVRWMEAAAEYLACTYAQAIQDIRYPDSTGNQWVPNERPHPCYIFSEYISNHAFYAWAHISEESSIKRGQGKCTAWYASYHVSVHLEQRSGLQSGHMIKSVDRKRFSDKEEALQYIAGRKEALAKLYFSSLDPVIPAECRSLFLFHGVELPGYRYEPANDEARA